MRAIRRSLARMASVGRALPIVTGATTRAHVQSADLTCCVIANGRPDSIGFRQAHDSIGHSDADVLLIGRPTSVGSLR